jgi:integrase
MNNTGWQNARHAVGLDRMRVHDLRHTFACRLRAAGVPAEDRAALLGHAEHSMSGHYASADVGRLIDLANLVLNRQETRTVLRVANGWPVEPATQRLWITGPAAVPQ